MPQLRRDPITGRWIIMETVDVRGPRDYESDINDKGDSAKCPFCTGNEKITPPEIMSYREPGTAPDTPGWSVRTVPNKFPALTIDGNLDKEGVGIYDKTNGIGAHEVIIETPDHLKEMADMSKEEVSGVVSAYIERTKALRSDKRFQYMLIFKNFGKSAGASLEHAHSQLIALPIVPKRVKDELAGAHRYFDYRGRCIFCDIIAQELEEDTRIVYANEKFISFTPFVARFPFETWIIPKRHIADFDNFAEDEIIYLAEAMQETLARIKKALGNPSYNFNIHTAPTEDSASDYYHWHIEIMPKLMGVAGFEWGSGFYINYTPSRMAAKVLREAG